MDDTYLYVGVVRSVPYSQFKVTQHGRRSLSSLFHKNPICKYLEQPILNVYVRFG